MPVTYQPWLVLLSIVMAIQGAYVGLSLSSEIGGAAGMRRRMLLAGAAFSLAVAIWTMHFVGMLAARLPFPVDYLVFPTLLSFLVCVIVVGAAVYAISSGPLTRAAAHALGRPDGRRHLHHALSRHERAACERPHDACDPVCGRQHGGRDRGVGSRALARGRARRAAAADPLGGRVRHRGVGHALHRDGRGHAASAREQRLDRARALDRPAGDRGRDRGVRRVGDLPVVPGAGPRARRATSRSRPALDPHP